VAVHVLSTAAVATAAGPPVGSVVGASVVTAAAVRVTAATIGRSTVRDDLAVAVATLWGSAGVCASTVGLSWELSSSTVGLRSALRLVALLSRFLAGGGWLTMLSTRMN
jgi:hypothetical protein